jgi:hypothetical protein
LLDAIDLDERTPRDMVLVLKRLRCGKHGCEARVATFEDFAPFVTRFPPEDLFQGWT